LNLIKIKAIAYDWLGERNSHSWKEKGNKYYHGERVAALISQLRKEILPKDDSHDEILTVSAWFHDIVNGIENHEKLGADKTCEILSNLCTPYELDEIHSIISAHDDRGQASRVYSDYIKLHQDADHLDHFGTFDVWAEFLFAAAHEQTINDTIEWFQKVRPIEDIKYRSEINFELCKKIFDEKSSFVKMFGNRLAVEGSGGVWNIQDILNK
jgi:HD superfamily phosphodiesterase